MVRFNIRTFFARISPFQPKPTLTAGKLHLLNHGTSPMLRDMRQNQWLHEQEILAAPAIRQAAVEASHARTAQGLGREVFLSATFKVEADAFNAMRQAYRQKQQPAPKPPPSPTVSAIDSDFDLSSLSDVSSLD